MLIGLTIIKEMFDNEIEQNIIESIRKLGKELVSTEHLRIDCLKEKFILIQDHIGLYIQHCKFVF